jgi:hypothetical protein
MVLNRQRDVIASALAKAGIGTVRVIDSKQR